jgi:methionyl-tRNA synthetase
MAALLPGLQAERKVEDLDFTGEDFVARVNSDLIGKYVNIASRCAGFIAKKFDGKLAGRCRTTPKVDRRALNGEHGERQAAIAASFERANSAGRCARSWNRRRRQPVRRREQALDPGQGRSKTPSCTMSAPPP